MKRRTLLLFVLSGWMSASAQTLLLKNGATIPADGLVRNGDLIMTSVRTSNGGSGQVGYNLSDIVELDLPIPAEIRAARDNLATGNYQHALLTIDPVLKYQKTIRDIPGNWWAQAALIEIEALAGLNRGPEASALVSEISSYSKDPQILASAKLQIALTTDFPDSARAFAAYDAILAESTDPRTISRAWIAEGDLRLAQHEIEQALMDYLTVTVFFPEHNPLLPRALWGTSQAYAKLKDAPTAPKANRTLVPSFPETPKPP